MPAKIPLLVLGIATDGPMNQMITSTDFKGLSQTFGGICVQNFTLYNCSGSFLTETTTSLSLAYLPSGSLLIQDISFRTPRLNPLYQPTLLGQTLSFGAIGTSSMNLLLTYQPTLGEADLLQATQNIFGQSSIVPAAVRVGGSYATLSASGWVFSSHFAGKKYNRIFLLFSASALTVFTTPTQYTVFDITSSSIKEDMNVLSQAGQCPIECVEVGSVATTGGFFLSGGTDGTLTEAAVEEALPLLDLNDVGAVLINLPLTNTLYVILRDYLNVTTKAPTLFLTQAPTRLTSELIKIYSTRINSEIPMRHDFLITVMGSALFTSAGFQALRPAVEGVAANYLSNPLRSPSNNPIKARSYEPVLFKEELQDLLYCGVNSLNRFIGSGISIYRGIASTGRKFFDQIICVQEVSFRIQRDTKRYLGQPYNEGMTETIKRNLIEALKGLPYGTLSSLNVSMQYKAIYIIAEVLVGGEIIAVNFSISNHY